MQGLLRSLYMRFSHFSNRAGWSNLQAVPRTPFYHNLDINQWRTKERACIELRTGPSLICGNQKYLYLSMDDMVQCCL